MSMLFLSPQNDVNQPQTRITEVPTEAQHKHSATCRYLPRFDGDDIF